MHKEQLCKLQPSPQQKQWRPEDNGRAPLKLSERKKEKKSFQPRKKSFKNESEIKTFSDKQN